MLALGALVAITSVILVILYGQTRIFFAMCRDGLMPERLAKVHPRFGTPAVLTLGLGGLIAVLAALVPLGQIVELVNIGTLFAFVLVNIGVIILRRTRPDMPRPYRVPWSPVLPLLGIAFAIYLMTDLPLSTWIRFVVWLAVGVAHLRRCTATATRGCAAPTASTASAADRGQRMRSPTSEPSVIG